MLNRNSTSKGHNVRSINRIRHRVSRPVLPCPLLSTSEGIVELSDLITRHILAQYALAYPGGAK